MAKITYTALREIEETTYSVNASDISVAAADDSFNAASTDLSGLPDDGWFQVGGFDNDENNGWFRANGASTSAKISQDTASDLVTEAAGLPILIQGYARGYGQSYDLDFSCQALDQGRNFNRRRKTPLAGGRPETLLYGREKFWTLKTDFIDAATLPQWEEFFASVAAGEVFVFDPYGSVAAEDNPLDCVLEKDGFDIARVGTSLLYEITAQIRVVQAATTFPVAPTVQAPFRLLDWPNPRGAQHGAAWFAAGGKANVP